MDRFIDLLTQPSDPHLKNIQISNLRIYLWYAVSRVTRSSSLFKLPHAQKLGFSSLLLTSSPTCLFVPLYPATLLPALSVRPTSLRGHPSLILSSHVCLYLARSLVVSRCFASHRLPQVLFRQEHLSVESYCLRRYFLIAFFFECLDLLPTGCVRVFDLLFLFFCFELQLKCSIFLYESMFLLCFGIGSEI